MRILVYGAGAIGSVIGGFLHRTGNDVTLYGRERYLRPVSGEGLHVSGIWGEHRIDGLRVCWDRAELGNSPCDVILLSVKAFDTAPAVAELEGLVGDSTLIVSLQNGVGNVEKIANRFGAEKTVGGRVIFGARVEQPGCVRVTVFAEEVMLGPLSDQADYSRIEALAETFSKAGIPTLPTREILKYLWAKVLYNGALNPLSVLFGATYGELAENPFTHRLMEEIIEEIFAVTRARGIPMFWDSPEGYKEKFFGLEVPNTVAHRSSMLQAIESGRRIDIDAINGEVVRIGHEENVPVPRNEMVIRLVRAKEWFLQNR